MEEWVNAQVEEAVEELMNTVNHPVLGFIFKPTDKSSIGNQCRHLMSMHYDSNPKNYIETILKMCFKFEQFMYLNSSHKSDSEIYHLRLTGIERLYHLYCLLIVNYCYSDMDQRPIVNFYQKPFIQLTMISICNDQVYQELKEKPHLLYFVRMCLSRWPKSMHYARKFETREWNQDEFIHRLNSPPPPHHHHHAHLSTVPE
jgi:hypothetical protein